MMWCEKEDARILSFDCRRECIELCDGRTYKIAPDVVGDFRALPFPDEAFYHVIFDPPHLVRAGENAWIRQKYGILDKETWRSDLLTAFAEAWRVLKPGGTLQFKWSTEQIPLIEVKRLYPDAPITQTGTHKTYLILFFKTPEGGCR